MKWICEYAELDTDVHNPRECEPFILDAGSYNDAKIKANEYMCQYYNRVKYDVREANDEEIEDYEYIG